MPHGSLGGPAGLGGPVGGGSGSEGGGSGHAQTAYPANLGGGGVLPSHLGGGYHMFSGTEGGGMGVSEHHLPRIRPWVPCVDPGSNGALLLQPPPLLWGPSHSHQVMQGVVEPLGSPTYLHRRWGLGGGGV